jgi:CBS domain-containing protein
MTPVVHSVTERASVESVARLMTRQHIHRVIVRRGRKVAGIISALDVLGALNATTDSESGDGRKTTRRTASRKRPAARLGAR